MNCPRCETLLQSETIKERNDEVSVETCSSCHGIWLDKGELQSLDNVSEPVLIEWRNIPSEYDQLTPLHCPSCGTHPMMKKAEHPRDEKVIFDYCESCEGIWLDGGELEAIQKESWVSAFFNLLRKMH